jgi:hypothetical protein
MEKLKNMARGPRNLEKGVVGSRTMEKSLQGCCFSNLDGSEGASAHSLVRLCTLPGYDTTINPSELDTHQADACRMLLLKL